jgi:hypothetical protein
MWHNPIESAGSLVQGRIALDVRYYGPREKRKVRNCTLPHVGVVGSVLSIFLHKYEIYCPHLSCKSVFLEKGAETRKTGLPGAGGKTLMRWSRA